MSKKENRNRDNFLSAENGELYFGENFVDVMPGLESPVSFVDIPLHAVQDAIVMRRNSRHDESSDHDDDAPRQKGYYDQPLEYLVRTLRRITPFIIEAQQIRDEELEQQRLEEERQRELAYKQGIEERRQRLAQKDDQNKELAKQMENSLWNSSDEVIAEAVSDLVADQITSAFDTQDKLDASKIFTPLEAYEINVKMMDAGLIKDGRAAPIKNRDEDQDKDTIKDETRKS